ncbi:MBL fold metallo-hydrolase [Pseudaquabacterium pictum]|jgi:glyoxylase-like metal-dependent hydrolase (beta-lactamase superfamily II)|uniref:MBL fold metallo-hydrolase n=1 Tax=Pseudaquabacterium pictum TaxID=2315236 RepID=A0A480AZT8_9BURK|nr:MBL fold metallo-hydrolase [Rubrivivax pictus]GCL65607.1 MBL fold metallo-hydrolase [Rubrivivax pictus]
MRGLSLRHAAALLLGSTLAWAAADAQAVEVGFQRMADGVYAHVGDTGARTAENEGLNANIGLVVTPAGAVLIDSGATFQSARQIAEAVRKVTDQPIKWVVNTGGQDHRWLGNGYFQAQGAELIAHAAGEADMKNRGNDHLQGLKAVLGAKADGTVPTLPSRWLKAKDERIELGGITFEFKHRGGAHTPGDTMVWLPQKNVLFTGDVVYVDRMLGVIPVSNTKTWLATFAVIEQLKPAVLVPGHGRVTNLATAQADTQSYLQALRAHMKKAVDDGTDVSAAVKSFDGAPFMRLLNAAELMPGNASRTYLELERE